MSDAALIRAKEAIAHWLRVQEKPLPAFYWRGVPIEEFTREELEVILRIATRYLSRY